MEQTNEVKMAILSMSSDELNEIVGLIKHRRSQINSQLKSNYSVGDKVYFMTKKKERVNCTVHKINRKYIVCSVDGSDWSSYNVMPSLLRLREAE